MLKEGVAQRKEKIEEFQKKINEVMLPVLVMTAYAFVLQKLLSVTAFRK